MSLQSRSLQVGKVLQAEVLECIGRSIFIVNFSGDLVRVKNTSQLNLKVGQRVNLKVQQIKPLSFQLLSPSPGHLNVSV